MAKGDPALAPLVEPLYGLRPTLAPTPLEMLVGSITAQQINLSFAFACRARLVRRYGTPVRVGRETVWAFPGGGAARASAAARAAGAQVLDAQGRVHPRPGPRRRGRHPRSRRRSARRPPRRSSRDSPSSAGSAGGPRTGSWRAVSGVATSVRPATSPCARRSTTTTDAGRSLSEKAIRRRADAWGQYQNLAVHYLLAGMRLAQPAVGGGT